jgi:alpha-2-macroglobulin
VPEALAYFAQGKRGNRWNSTKDTAMILYAMCDYLAKSEVTLGGDKVATLKLNDNLVKQTLRLEDGLTGKAHFAGAELKAGENILHFDEASPGMMFRLNLKYRQVGNAIAAQANGMEVQRVFWLLDPKTGGQTQLKDGDTVPRGSYLQSRVTATSGLADQMRYVLVQNPKPGSCEIQPAEDRRFEQNSTPHVLREDKEVGVFWHHEQTNGSLHDTCVLRCEMAGEFVIAPAQAELMYKPEVRGHSGTFRIKVVDEAKDAAKPL